MKKVTRITSGGNFASHSPNVSLLDDDKSSSTYLNFVRNQIFKYVFSTNSNKAIYARKYNKEKFH